MPVERSQNAASGSKWNATPDNPASIATGPAFQPQEFGDPQLRRAEDPNAGQRFSQAQGVDPNAFTKAPSSFDATSPGEYEQWQQNQQGQFMGPSAGQTQNAGMQGYLGSQTNAQGVSNSLQAQPNFDAFYDRARERQAGGMNDQMAARGGYGSSAGMDMMMQGQSDLNAQQANREADYMQAHQGQRITAAGQADSANAAQRGLGIQGASAADASGLARLRAGGEAAATAQEFRQGRGDTFFNRERANRNDMANLVQPWLMGQIDADAQSFDSGMALEMGAPRDQVNYDFADNAAQTDRVNTAVNGVAQGVNVGSAAGGF